MAETLQAFFFGTSFGEQSNGKPTGLFGFAIPELGLVYRSCHAGTIYECQYAGLLALLKFIETNRKQFDDFEFEVLSDSALIIYQISHRKFISKELAPYYNSAINYKNRVNYRVSWVPRQENAAIIGLDNTPTFKPEIEFKIDMDSHDNDQTMRIIPRN
jgi:hypothetical protein